MLKSIFGKMLLYLPGYASMIFVGITQIACNKSNELKNTTAREEKKPLVQEVVPAKQISDSDKYDRYLKSVFGSGVNFFPVDTVGQPIIGDIDGDGFKDSLFIGDVTNGKEINQGIISTNPWCTNMSSGCKPLHLSILKGPGLALVLGNKSNVDASRRAFLFQLEDENPLDCNSFDIHKGFRLIDKSKYQVTIDSLGIKEDVESPYGDVVVLGTPGSVDQYLYFDGKSFRMFSPQTGDD